MFKFTQLFVVSFLCIVIICSLITYATQKVIYENQCENNALSVATFLRDTIVSDKYDFINYREGLIKYKDDIDIPLDFNEYKVAKENYYDAYDKECELRGKYHIEYHDLPEDIQKLFIIYRHEYYTLLFENISNEFDYPYVYYVESIGGDDSSGIYYVIDAERTKGGAVNDIDLLKLCDEYDEVLENYPVFTQILKEGSSSSTYDSSNENYGSVNTYYAPVILDGILYGVVCIDVKVDYIKYNLMNSINYIILGLVITILTIAIIMLYVIYNKFIMRVETLSNYVVRYTYDRDPVISNDIEANVQGYDDEIATLYLQFSEMIQSFEIYINNILNLTGNLDEAKNRINEISEQATTDSLTGVNNKLAYDNAVRQLNIKIDLEEDLKFAIAMIDLNFLKKINDTYGHQCGNKAIINISRIIQGVFKGSEVYRVGGDEFVVILEGDNYNNLDILVLNFINLLRTLKKNENLKDWERVSAAIGYSRYKKEDDDTVKAVFKRADKQMYDNKVKMKAERKD